MQVGEFPLQNDVVVVGARDVARATGTGAALVQRGMHGRQHSIGWIPV
jgi:hypothetical protein